MITKFSGMGRLPHFLSYGAPPTRALRARVELRYNLISVVMIRQQFACFLLKTATSFKGRLFGKLNFVLPFVTLKGGHRYLPSHLKLNYRIPSRSVIKEDHFMVEVIKELMRSIENSNSPLYCKYFK